MKCARSCSMHKCWENIYDWSEHSHRDPVANVVIYSAFAFFFGVVALGTVFKNIALKYTTLPCGLTSDASICKILKTYEKHLELHFMSLWIHHVSCHGMAMILLKPLKVASLIAVTWLSHSVLLSVPSASLQSVLLLVRFTFQSFTQSSMELASVEFSSNFTHFAL